MKNHAGQTELQLPQSTVGHNQFYLFLYFYRNVKIIKISLSFCIHIFMTHFNSLELHFIKSGMDYRDHLSHYIDEEEEAEKKIPCPISYKYLLCVFSPFLFIIKII